MSHVQKQKKRILIVTSTFPRWAGDTDPNFVFDLARQLVHMGHSVDVIAPHARHAHLYEEIDNIHVTRYRYFFSAWQSLCYAGGIPANLKNNPANYLLVPFFLLAQLVCVCRTINKKKYDVVNAHWLIPQGFICALGKIISGQNELPLVCTVHGSDMNGLTDIISKRCKAWTLKHCQRLIVVSQALEKLATKLDYPRKKISVCPMGVDLKVMFTTKTHSKRERNHLIFVGRLITSKGVDQLIRAMVKVRQKYPDTALTIIGDGPEALELKQLVSASELDMCVEFKGAIQRSCLPEQYTNASIAVLPSIQPEGFGLVMIEAMGCGCAVIASEHESAKEIIQDGINGLLVPPGDENALAAAIIHLLDDEQLLACLAAEGRESVITRYDWESVSGKYAAALFHA